MKQEFETEITKAINRLITVDRNASSTIYKLYQYAKMLEDDHARQMDELLKFATEQTFHVGKVDITEI